MPNDLDDEISARIAAAIAAHNADTQAHYDLLAALDARVTKLETGQPPVVEPEPPVDPPVVEPPAQTTLTIPAEALDPVNAVTMTLAKDATPYRWKMWGQPREATLVRLRVAQDCDALIALGYVLAGAESSTRQLVLDGVVSGVVTLTPTCTSWDAPVVQRSAQSFVHLKAGEHELTVINGSSTPWANWCDLVNVEVRATAVVEIVTGPVVGPPPTLPSSYDYAVGRDGSLQDILTQRDTAGKSVWVPRGVYGDGFNLGNAGKDFGRCTVVFEDGCVFRGAKPFVSYGFTRGLKLVAADPLAWWYVEPDPQDPYAEGIIFDRGGCDNVWIEGVQIAPVAGVSARNGIAVWHCSNVTVSRVRVSRVARTLYGGDFGGAGSAISIGAMTDHGVGPMWRSDGAQLVIEDFSCWDIGDPTGTSADMNAVIIDLGDSDGNAPRPDRVRGPRLIRRGVVDNVRGRAVQILRASMLDSPITIEGVKVTGPWGRGLGQFAGRTDGEPRCAIGGYGAGFAQILTVKDCSVSTDAGNGNGSDLPAYKFQNFDGAGAVGILGSGNRGNRVDYQGCVLAPGFLAQ